MLQKKANTTESDDRNRIHTVVAEVIPTPAVVVVRTTTTTNHSVGDSSMVTAVVAMAAVGRQALGANFAAAACISTLAVAASSSVPIAATTMIAPGTVGGIKASGV